MTGRQGAAGQGFLANVESIRGIAALYVAFGHVLGITVPFAYATPVFQQETARDFALKLFTCLVNGQTAVIVFFVISGLVIGRSLDRKDSVLSVGHAYAVFLVRRVLRLYPAHIVALAGIIGLAWLFLMHRPRIDFSAFPVIDPMSVAWFNAEAFNQMTWRNVAANLSMGSWTFNLVVWSLYVEVCVAPLLPVFHRLARTRNACIDLGMLAALVALTVFTWEHLWSRYWFAFYLGMLIDSRGARWAELLGLVSGGRWAALAVSYLMLSVPIGFARDHPAVVIAQVFGAFSLLSVVVWRAPRSLDRALLHPALRWNGRISYSFYLWHFFIFTIFAHHLYANLAPAALRQYEIPIFFATLIVTVAIALGVAQLSYAHIELPSLRLGRKIEGRLREVVTALRARRAAPGVLAAP